MDCSFDGDAPERKVVLDHTPTEEEWEKILVRFSSGKARKIIATLHRGENTPLTVDAHPEVTWGRIGGMNRALRKAGLRFHLTPAYEGGPWDHIRLERIGVATKLKKADESEERVRRCCK